MIINDKIKDQPGSFTKSLINSENSSRLKMLPFSLLLKCIVTWNLYRSKLHIKKIASHVCLTQQICTSIGIIIFSL